MRIKLKPDPKSGDIRIKRKFLFFPKKINNEIVLFEFALIEQTMKCVLRTNTYTYRTHSTYVWETTGIKLEKDLKK